MMTTPLPMKRGDRLPIIAAQLILPDNTVAVLTGCTVTFTLRSATGRVLIDRAAASIVVPLEGRVSYAWQPGDTDTLGIHEAEWIVTYPGGAQMTVPNKGYDKIEVSARLT
jgi:hypothetical protein